jgi:hypothetical protein
MEIVDHHGLAMALAGSDELAARPWLAEHVDVVRVRTPPPQVWPDLAALGFIRKPEMLTWRAELLANEAEFLSRLVKKSRQNIRRSREQAAAALRLTVHDRIDEGLLDQFLTLYRERVEAMPYGITIACKQRDRLLGSEGEKYYAVFATAGDQLVGGCLVRECPEEDTVRVRFSAVTEQWRDASLARTLFFEAMRVARDKGYRYATLGDEPNLYGHLTKAGLFVFKVAMGFECVPSQDFHDPDGGDVADLVLSVANLTAPCLVMGYASAGERTLTANLITEEPMDTRRYAAPFLAGARRLPVGPPV